MAHSLLRTASMAMNKKNYSKGAKLHTNHINGGGGGRRHTMLPRPGTGPHQTRDSVLSNGSSDRSSSVSDDPGPTPLAYGNDFFSIEAEEQMRVAWTPKCCFVVKEIMQTEIAYVQALADIIKGYLTPLYSHLLNSGESPNFIKTVFSNIVRIHQTHQELMESFQETFTSPHEFASAFLQVDFLSLYTHYCTSFTQGNECLEKSLHENPDLRDFIERCQHDLGHSLPLSSQLIKPVQRILKYRLLLEELNKHFDKHHPDFGTIQNALQKMESVAEQINTSFTNQKRSSKGVPSAVAKRRTHQIRDLQVSRSVKSRRRPSDSPTHSRLGRRSVSETHLNHPPATNSSAHADNHTLPNGLWKPADLGSKSVGMYTISQSSKSSEEKKGLGESLPNVQLLKSYFEKLGEEESRENYEQRPSEGGMKKAKSMSGSRKNSISSAGLTRSPSKSPKWSPPWSPGSWSPIKVPVLPHSPPKSPAKFSALSPRKYPSNTPPTLSPTKTSLSPQRKPHRCSSGGSYIRSSRSSGRIAETQLDSPVHTASRTSPDHQATVTTATTITTATGRQITKVMATRKISEEIRRHIAESKAAKRDHLPKTMV